MSKHHNLIYLFLSSSYVSSAKKQIPNTDLSDSKKKFSTQEAFPPVANKSSIIQNNYFFNSFFLNN